MSQSTIYVGNISFNTSQEGLEDHFGKYGDITEVKIITDRETGNSRGFAFVTFATPASAQSALVADNQDLDGRKVRVNLAKPMKRAKG